jgi:hypothetical protein
VGVSFIKFSVSAILVVITVILSMAVEVSFVIAVLMSPVMSDVIWVTTLLMVRVRGHLSVSVRGECGPS